MRASDLIGLEVRYGEERLGTVIDLRLATGLRAGNAAGGDAAAGDVTELRLDGLVVSPARWGGRISYDRRDAGRPWLLWQLISWLHRKDRYVRWELIRDWADGVVRVDPSDAELPGVPALPS